MPKTKRGSIIICVYRTERLKIMDLKIKRTSWWTQGLNYLTQNPPGGNHNEPTKYFITS